MDFWLKFIMFGLLFLAMFSGFIYPATVAGSMRDTPSCEGENKEKVIKLNTWE